MKTRKMKRLVVFLMVSWWIGTGSIQVRAQQTDQRNPAMDQNISIYAEDESLSNVIERICSYFHLDYSYNSKLVEGKQVSLNISNKPIRYVLDKLMKDYYLLFDIEDNILVLRDYVPLSKTRDYEEKMRFTPGKSRFEFENPKKKSISLNFKTASNLIIIPVNINDSDTLNFILDTGVRFPIITELPYVNRLSLNFMQPVSINGLGQGESLTAYRSENNLIKIDGLVAHSQEIHMVIDENFRYPRSWESRFMD